MTEGSAAVTTNDRPSAKRASRLVVASYDSYADAQRAIDHLSDSDFPVERCAIVAEGLQIVERVTGRVGYREATVSGMANGAWVGAIVGLVLGLFSFRPVVSGLVLAWWGLLIGGAVGALLGLAGHAMRQGRRDFASIQDVQAQRYDVTVDAELAARAGQLLHGHDGRRAAPVRVVASEPVRTDQEAT